MSTDDPMNEDLLDVKPVISPASSDEVELILEDEVEEVQLLSVNGEPVTNGHSNGLTNGHSNGLTNGHQGVLNGEVHLKLEEFDEDDDLIVIEDEEEEERKEFFDETLYRMEKEKKEAADRFFDPESPTSVAKLSPEIRKHASKYAAAMFEWFCCMPTPDLLVIIPAFADIDTPFPVTPDRKRALVRREFGARMADVWRQTKSTEKLANHFKLFENVAVLTLLDFAFANPSHDVDVFPLLKLNGIDKVDYFVVASFVIEHSDPQKWKEPAELIGHTLLTPMGACIGLYMLSAECVRGTSLEIPWDTLERDMTTLKPEEMAAFEEVIREGMEQLQMNDPFKKMNEESEIWQKNMEASVDGMRAEERKIRQQMKIDMAVLADLSERYAHVQAVRNSEIAMILPANFDDHGRDLEKADEECVAVDVVRTREAFKRNWIMKEDLHLEKGDKCFARRKLDSMSRFEEAVFVEMDDSLPNNARICFAHTPDAEVSLPLESIAMGKSLAEIKMAAKSEGVRVVARARHPLHPKETAIYSGTIISKFWVQSRDYAVAFDDFFDDYVRIDSIHLLMVQPLDEKTGHLDRRLTYLFITPSIAAPSSTKERKVFLLAYLTKYPEWNLVKTHERIGAHIYCKHRNGKSWITKSLAIDRQMIWLRFNEDQAITSDSGCLDFPCTKHAHHDEKMYRGNPRLKQMRTACNFDKIMAIHESFSAIRTKEELAALILNEIDNPSKQTRQDQRRMCRVNRTAGISFEPAVPIDSKKKGAGVQKGQTARKCGTGLMMEPAVPDENRRKKKEIEVKILHHEDSKLEWWFTDEKGSDPYHTPCNHECLKGLDADPFDPKFVRDNISPYYVPALCGWRRMRQVFSLVRTATRKESGVIYYRTPCGRPLFRMSEVVAYLKETRSELTVDLFSFTWDVDETAYVVYNRKYLKSEDMTGGSEARPITVINEIDDEEAPSFIYRKRRYPLNDKVTVTTMNKEFCTGCDCVDDCSDWTKCACQRLTHRESVRGEHAFRDISRGYDNRLLFEKVHSGIYECNENCPCSRKRCINRVVQNDLKVPMQMMKTHGMGWGVRALADIPAGTYISCYHGAVLSDDIGEINGEGDEYYADLDFYQLAEAEKANAGIELAQDQGVFFEDVGLRELTLEEIEKVEKVDSLTNFRKEVEAEKLRRKKEEQKRQALKKQLEEARKAERAANGASSQDENDEGARRATGGADVEDVQRKESSADTEETEEEDGQREREGEAADDDDVDEGVEDGDSAAESMDEDDDDVVVVQPNSPQSEEKEREEREKKERERQKQLQLKREVEGRYLIPMKDENERLQLDAYFEDASCDHLFLLDAKSAGNIGRQFNHGCEPNMFTQHIFVDTHDIRLPWVAFFAKRDIKAGEELNWDYGWNPDVAHPRGLKCQCGAEGCRVDLL